MNAAGEVGARPLEGRAAIVTGGASGIGWATVRALAERGCSVLVADVAAPPDGAARETIAYRRTDVTDPDDVTAMVNDAVGRFGRLDLAVNAAGTAGSYAPLAEQRLEAWQRTIAINLTGVFLCLQAEVPAIVASGGGAIVNVSSGAGLRGFAHLPAYVASKHGVVGLTRSVALEVARTGVRVNAVCPGSVRTPMLLGFAGGDEAAMESLGAMAPMGRLGEPDEIAEAIVWLCSDSAAFVTGAALPVDGGVMAT